MFLYIDQEWNPLLSETELPEDPDMIYIGKMQFQSENGKEQLLALMNSIIGGVLRKLEREEELMASLIQNNKLN